MVGSDLSKSDRPSVDDSFASPSKRREATTDSSRASVISMAKYWSLECFPDLNAEDTRSLCFCLERAADLLRQDQDRIECLERWWYTVPEEQRLQIMGDVAWKRHEAALPGGVP